MSVLSKAFIRWGRHPLLLAALCHWILIENTVLNFPDTRHLPPPLIFLGSILDQYEFSSKNPAAGGSSSHKNFLPVSIINPEQKTSSNISDLEKPIYYNTIVPLGKNSLKSNFLNGTSNKEKTAEAVKPADHGAEIPSYKPLRLDFKRYDSH